MAKFCTDRSQSERLTKMGVTGADVYATDGGGVANFPICSSDGEAHYWQAWSLAALIDLLPSCVFDGKGNSFGLNMQKGYVEYYNPSMGSLYARYYSTGADTLLDAVVEAVCWLIDNGHLKLTK